MKAESKNQYIKIYVRSLVIQIYFIFENFSFVVHFTLDKTAVLFWVTRYLLVDFMFLMLTYLRVMSQKTTVDESFDVTT